MMMMKMMMKMMKMKQMCRNVDARNLGNLDHNKTTRCQWAQGTPGSLHYNEQTPSVLCNAGNRCSLGTQTLMLMMNTPMMIGDPW